MVWVATAVVVVVVVGLVVAHRRRGRNSGVGRARDVAAHHKADADAHAAHTQHQGNIYGSGGGGLPF